MEERGSWGRRLKAFRRLKGFTQESLAKAVHVSVSVIGLVERGNKKPSPQLLQDIADVLQVDIEEIKGERREKE